MKLMVGAERGPDSRMPDGLRCREMKGGNGSDVVDGGGPPPPLWASRHPPQPPETTTTGICPAISGATQNSPCFECSRLVDLSLLNLAHSSQLTAR